MLDPNKGSTLKMKHPDSIAIANFLIGNFLCGLKEPDTNNSLLLLLNLPAMKNTIHPKVNKQVPHIKSLQNLHIEEGGTVKRNVSVDVLLVVVAGLQGKEGVQAGDLAQLQQELV
jgi:hypothetical protein